MHKVGKSVHATVEEIMAMKTDERLFRRFVALSSDWVNAKAFGYARTTKGELSEWKTWLAAGLWNAVRIADERLKGVGGVYSLAWRDAMKAYVATYVNAAQKTEDACDSCHRDGEGGFEDIEIPDLDENIQSLDFTNFMENLRTKVSERDYIIIHRRLHGSTLDEIGKIVGISKQGVQKIFEKNLRHLRQYA